MPSASSYRDSAASSASGEEEGERIGISIGRLDGLPSGSSVTI